MSTVQSNPERAEVLMKDFFAWLFSQNNSSLQITLFDGWHFLYLAITFFMAIFFPLFFKNRSEKAKDKVIEVFAYLVIGLYVADFFIMPLSDSYNGISTYKLPFNLCTAMAVLVPFVQFNKKITPIKDVVVTLSITSSLMWMCYPGSALGGQPPFSYVIFQTFMYHALLFCWGVCNLAFGRVTLSFKKIWRVLVAILIMLVWASFGNMIYDDGLNWFFIEKSIFPFLPDNIMPLVVVVIVFACSVAVHLLYYAIRSMVRSVEKGQKRKQENASSLA